MSEMTDGNLDKLVSGALVKEAAETWVIREFHTSEDQGPWCPRSRE